MISPKLISVELNRVGTDDITGRNTYSKKELVNIINSKNVGSQDDKWKGGRFPTQLFTNIKNDKFKYVKIINF